MIRVALIAGTYQPHRCGVADYTAQLRQALAAQPVETSVLTTFDAAEQSMDRQVDKSLDSSLDDNFYINTYKNVYGVVKDWSIASLIPLTWAIHHSRADVLHIQHAAGTYHFNRAIFLLPLLLKITGWRAPIVTTVHEYGWWEWQPAGIPVSWLEWLKNWGQRQTWWDREDGFLLTQSQAIITTNASAETTIQQRLPQLTAQLHRIPIGANVSVSKHSIPRPIARQQLRQRYGWNAASQVIVFFGFLHPVKGLETLLDAFKILYTRYPQVRLLLLGGVESLALPGQQSTTYWQQLQRQIGDLGLEQAVQMTGYLEAEQASALLLGADLGVLPFHHGVTLKSGSLLALMGHGLPVVATRATPPDPDLESLPLVRLVAPRQVQELALQLEVLFNSPSPLDFNSQPWDLQTWSQQFSWDRIAERHFKIYRQVLGCQD